MVLKKLDVTKITREEFYQFADIERAGRRFFSTGDVLLNLLERWDVYACFDGNTMAGYIVIDPACRYFGRSLLIESIKPHWQYNTAETLSFLIRSAAAQYPQLPDSTFVTVDCRKPEENAALYRSLGFAKSILPSRLGSQYTVYLKAIASFRKEASTAAFS